MTDRLYAGTRKGLFTLRRDSSDAPWSITGTAFLGTKVPMLLSDPRDGALYAALEHGHFDTKLHRSRDGGETWEEVTAPAYPPKPDDVPESRYPMRDIVIPWSLEKIWSLEAGGPDQPGVLWCGTLPGGLFRSADGGDSWELVESLWNRPERAQWMGGGYDYPGIHSVCVDPRDSAHVAVGVSCGGVWKTEDGGATWAQAAHGMRADYAPPETANDPETQDPHRMVRCPAAPDHFWVQHHNGIFRSTNGGTQWEEITGVEPSAFGFGVAVHPDDPATAWFVPAVKDEMRIPKDGRLVVTRTRDGGRNFETLSRGLPQEHAYDLVFRHALEVDPAGQSLAFGSTTGSLYTSDDQGDSWTAAAQHLPPVYCLRFG